MATNSEYDGKFYLGRLVEGNSPTTTKLLYDPTDLTTHAVVVGMTGSGKTGLCISLLEEAALQGFPALLIDPKGDITNLLLQFPNLQASDFAPWINADAARRAGQTIEQAAAATAQTWSEGLAAWDIQPERIARLSEAAEFAVYTPGSDSGLPVSILASLQAPAIPWEENRELLREKISGVVTALLGLVGLNDIDPVRSREHILLANIFEGAWKAGRDLDLGELIMQTQTPPFQKLGVFDVNTFFPEKDRFGLAMLLNNILAAPAFQVWIEGQPLDIPRMLYSPSGKPRHSIFYIAHLSETERMFFVTLLYSAIESWMRAQTGTTGLRALVYFDEIFGYLPPLGNPPSKTLMLRMLKQARAFGVGQLLATQNPVDLDYKALSNTGTWIIGKLQTDQDKQRLLDGLQGALPSGLDRSKYDRLISSLGKRVFLLHNVHEREPVVFQTRWAMSYLAGPLARPQLPQLNRLRGVAAPAAAATLTPPAAAAPRLGDTQPVALPREAPAASPAVPPAAASAAARAAGSTTRPAIPTGFAEYFLPLQLSLGEALQAARLPFQPEIPFELLYRPGLLAQAQVRFLNRKYDLDTEQTLTALVAQPDRRGVVRWEDHASAQRAPQDLRLPPVENARYAALDLPLNEARRLTALQRDFLDWAYRNSVVTVRAHEALKIYAGPDRPAGEFRRAVVEAAQARRDQELQKIVGGLTKKLEALRLKLARAERDLDAQESDYNQRKMEELGTAAENVFGLFGGRKSTRRLSSSLSKRRLTEQAKQDVQDARQNIQDLRGQVAALEQEIAAASAEIEARWAALVEETSELTVPALRKDIDIDLFGVIWLPYFRVQSSTGAGVEWVELPAFKG